MNTLEDFKEQTVSGIKWNLVEQVLVYVVVFIATIFLSRILLPEEFGLFGMLTVLGNLATLVVGMGLSYSVIHNQTLVPEDFSTIFWFNLFLGLLTALAFFVGAPVIATFYGQSDLIVITRLFCIGFIAQGVNSVPVGLLIKGMQFKKLAITNTVAIILSYTVSIVLALEGYGVWSLVVHFIVLHIITVSLNLTFCGWRPTLSFHLAALHKVKKFSTNFLGSQLIDFSANNLDSILIGKYAGKKDLGFFGRASALVTIPVTSLGYVLNRTFFPWFSALQKDLVDLNYRYTQSLRVLIMLVIPILLLLSATSKEVVLLLFGNQWAAIAPFVTLLSAYASFQCINAFHDSFIISQGRSDILLKVSVVEKSLMVIGVIVGLRFGVVGIIWAKLIVIACVFLPRIWTICQILKIPMSKWFGNIYSLMLSLILLWIVAFSVSYLLEESHYLIRLIGVCLSSIAAYYLYLASTGNQAMNDLQKIIKLQFSKYFSR